MCIINDNHIVVWFLTYGARPTRIFCHFGPFFALLPPPNDPQNQNFIKTKLTPGDIILQMCTKMLGSHDVQFLRYGARQTDEQTENVTCRGGCPT